MERSNSISHITDLRNRISVLTENRIDYIRQFYIESKMSFSYSIKDDGNPESEPGLTSTATCILILKEWDELSKICPNEREIGARLVKRKWKSGDLGENNAYTVALLLPALHELGVDDKKPEVQRGLKVLKEKIAQGNGGVSLFPDAEKETRSAFLTYWALESLGKFDRSFNKSAAFSKAIDWAENEVYRQLSYFHSGESDFKNVHQLSFAWAICEKFPNRSPLSPTVSLHVLELIFGDQKEEGIWPLYYPLFNFPKVGSAYVHHFELLLAVTWTVRKNFMVLKNYLDKLERVVNWAESRLIKHESGVLGWSIATDPQRRHKPISWATIEVLQVLCHFDEYLAKIQREFVFHLYSGGGTRTQKQPLKLDKVIDIDIVDQSMTVKQVLRKHIIDPIVSNDRTLAGIESGPAQSIILFGPPGTSKTTLASVVAGELGWPLLEIDPSHFVPRGGTEIEMRVIEVFSHLEKVYDTIILLDEMEELMRERRSGESDRIGRFWTTLMLPLLSRLRSKANSVIFVSTNYITEIDVAASRPARIDIVLPVGPPRSEGKLKWLAKNLGVPETNVDGWWKKVGKNRQECFDKLLFGDLPLLIQEMKGRKSRPAFSTALANIESKIYLCKTEKDQPKNNWEIFKEASISNFRVSY